MNDQWLGAKTQEQVQQETGEADIGAVFVKAMQPCPDCGVRLALVKSEWAPGSTEQYGLAFDFRCQCQLSS